MIQHDYHHEHLLTLKPSSKYENCRFCDNKMKRQRFVYICNSQCGFGVCFKCALPELELNHPSHNHTLTFMPMIALHTCTACGMEGRKDFSYLCKTCLFWIHKSCACAPANLICKTHDNDHPLVLAYSLPEEYLSFGVSCNLCPEMVYPCYWLYYCAECRYFAHVHCALSAGESGKNKNRNDDEGDIEVSGLVHFPVSESEPYLLYRLIQQYAKKFSSSTDEKSGKADIISQCRNGHSLILFDAFTYKDAVERNNNDNMRCDGCVQPLISSPGPFYGCLDCNFFLHRVCAAELPREIQHASHPRYEFTRLTRCYETSTPFNFYTCGLCEKFGNGIFYSDESSGYLVDIGCAAIPSEIKHKSHKHTLHQLSGIAYKNCRGCGYHIQGRGFKCKICNYYIHIKCVLKPGTIKHRWDEHQLLLMFPPVKGHPHAFNCELCSNDINPNYWFYHCRKCDTSFHDICIDQDFGLNIKYGGIFKVDNLHKHSLELTGTRQNFICGKCGESRDLPYEWQPHLKCGSCKFCVCIMCIVTYCGSFRESKSSR
ncbi:uncharacterized protein LOC141660701 [Apium graveolens]|uniref:uncharacterized protein LOC141660701 n=1 Tax=Apium graveolens TaxID=4045 RepID=UPI003D78B320